MALIEQSLIWVTYAVAVALLLAPASIFVYVYQKPSERAYYVTVVCISTITTLLATVLLLPVDVALVSSTVRSRDGARKEWATQDRVDNIVFTLQVIYYSLYSLDALLCLVVLPFTYFFVEEKDDLEVEEGNQTLGNRLWGALKYTIVFLCIFFLLFTVGFFVPVAKYEKGKHRDLDYFKDLLSENRERCTYSRHTCKVADTRSRR